MGMLVAQLVASGAGGPWSLPGWGGGSLARSLLNSKAASGNPVPHGGGEGREMGCG